MKKLKLYGEGKILFIIPYHGIIADVFINGSNTVVVESRIRSVRIALQKALDDFIRDEELVLRTGIIAKNECKTIGIVKKPGDKDFLEALKAYSPFWSGRRFGDYKIFRINSRIVDE